ncbi:MAG: hypothetical protein ABIG89_06155 [Candidatus Woesearchaeota archaeon]
MMEKRYKRNNLLIIILMIAVVFCLGILIGKHIKTGEQGDVDRFIKHLELNTESFLVEQELLGTAQYTQDCSLTEERISSLSSELYNLGVMLGDPKAESNLGKDSYLLLKKKFHLMQIRTYMLYNTFRKSCNFDEHVILFYYKRDDIGSKEQGKILDEVVKLYPINVFAIEYNYSMELTFLEDYYQIAEAPAIVIDYEDVHKDFTNYEEIVNTII